MDSSVTVVEWGHERVEHLSDSRLEIDLLRAIGLDISGNGAGGGTLDFDGEDTDEPRTIVMRGYGPRWASAPELGGPELGGPELGGPELDAPQGDVPC
jgi:tRNA threonylcarbamoyladenosine biosynthesis protein TsaE